MRLIDADDFKKFMQALCKAGSPYESFIELLDKQTTAYDIGKVVEKLEVLKRIYFLTIANTGDEKSDFAYENVGNALDKAIEIVKQGGVSDDVCEWRLCGEDANVYDTSCRNPHILIEGTPKENNYEYCPYCGKKIKVVE